MFVSISSRRIIFNVVYFFNRYIVHSESRHILCSKNGGSTNFLLDGKMATHEGILYKLGEKGLIKTWKSRYFEMRDGFMYYYKHKGESEIGRIDLNQGKSIP